MSDGEAYSGVLGAFPYALRQSDSRLFRLYAVVGGLVAAVLVVFFALALVKAINDSVGGGAVSAYRAMIVLLAVAVVLPVMAPVLFVARRYRRGLNDEAMRASDGETPPTTGYDRLMALLGFAFLLAGYVAFVISVPESYETTPSGPLAPVATALYEAPVVASPLPPVAVATAMLLFDRLYGRRREPTG